MSEEPFEGEESEGSEAQEPEASYPIRTSITVTKVNHNSLVAPSHDPLNLYLQTGKGALSIDAIAQDGAFVVDNISFYKEGNLATDLTAEADWKRRGLYIGPQVCSLQSF